MKRVVVLISGRGSNLLALHQRLSMLAKSEEGVAEIVAVISNKPEAAGLRWAQAQGLQARCLDHRDFESREAYDKALARVVSDHQPDLVVLAGFMRVLTKVFVQRFAGRLINIHPSLLPAFPGLQTHQRALEAGVCLHGATVHFVNEQLDGGPIIAQAFVPVLQCDEAQSLADRVLHAEHRLLPQVVVDFCHGLVALDPLGRLQRSPEATHLLFPPTSGEA
jgi:phosphoribosylglycinamide formyltransferase-1